MATETLDRDIIRRAPKALLHDHLDGGLRPATILDLADQVGHCLPADDEAALAEWFHRGADRLDLGLYLETFEHTVGVMQTADACHRVAAECASDLAEDGCVYAEVRFAPALHTERGMKLPEVLEAVLAGFADGSAGTGLTIRTLVTAMRTSTDSREVAELAVRYRDQGVVGFDIAGREAGYPPTLHLDAFQFLQRENFHFTIHAGEAFGPASIWEAVQFCGAERLGHGVRIVDDITVDADGTARLGRLASFVRDRRIPLELCPTSNVHTGAVADLASHPIGLLRSLGFRVTVNTDNRLMSDVSMTSEMADLLTALGWGLDDMRWLTINGLKSAFLPFDERLALIEDVVKPGYAALAG
ncbi:MAG: adenosine deaminase [Actinomycetota bacterium]|nr:adenosine deaminase [Actinomycetota bacterium]MEC9467434.1 adenosine deaminase [Actinomycetota bacterium]MED5221065.1 adenosine deaminase [Actinomycetota bacterium]MED6327875.1 adenosine deaminase [Actinomycetota bacterium]MEE2958545.1 adenosine deaminase [Actinomycetota bacterium]